MFKETIKSEGLAHLSYVFGDGGKAAVVDPRRDGQVYVDLAYREGCQITHIFETHRNEDYVIGSQDLARRTGAGILHGGALDFQYGRPVSEGDAFDFGNLRVRVLETPGHTYESISLALADTTYADEPVAVFTGDALFINDVGRTDFFPDSKEEVSGLLFDSIHDKLLPLGDHVILHPAHGAGSVCGSGMADREFSTLGYERKHNPRLRLERDAFVQFKVDEPHYQPPYFRKMEEYNQNGNAPRLQELPHPKPMNPAEFGEAMDEGMVAVDVRSPEGFAGAFVPGSLAIPLNMLPAYAGWFPDYGQPIGLITRYEEYDHVEKAVRHLIRMGYDNIAGFLEGGMHSWESSGRAYGRIPAVQVDELQQRLRQDGDLVLLDVRKIDEYQEKHLPNAKHIFLGDLPRRLDEVPKDRVVITFCGSGRRAIIAASILKKNGFDAVEDSLGSMSACAQAGCDLVSGD